MDVSSSPAAAATARHVLAAWFADAPIECAPPVVAGFSGAPVSRVRPRGEMTWFVLKPFAVGIPRARAERVHDLILHLHASGVGEVPRPLATAAGGTLASDDRGRLWELVPFVDGAAVTEPSAAQAAAALATLARIHVAAAAWPEAPPSVGPAPCVARRRDQALALQARSWHARRAVLGGTVDPALIDRWDRAIAAFDAADGRRAVAAIAAARADAVPVQMVLRDVWSAHVLFARETPAHVAGVIDVHAAAVDSPATDLARLLGSYRGGTSAADPLAAWPGAVAAYESIRPLAADERRLVSFLHASAVVCGLDNWFRWTCEDGRTFAPNAAHARIDRMLEDLPAALAVLAECPEFRV